MVKGSLRIYLGAAPGVGKTYSMLNEGYRKASRGADVVILPDNVRNYMSKFLRPDWRHEKGLK